MIGNIISFALFSNARLNFEGVSRLRTEFLSLVHSLTDEGANEEFVEESLQKGTIRSLPFLRCKKAVVQVYLVKQLKCSSVIPTI